jgi:hypothetical protein
MTTIQLEQTTISNSAERTAKQHLLTKEQYLDLKAHWKALPRHSAMHHIGYNLLRGFEATRGFTPCTARKVASRGNDPWQGFNIAVLNLRMITGKLKPLNDEPSYMVRYSKRVEEEAARFKAMFGITITDEIREAMKLERKNA